MMDRLNRMTVDELSQIIAKAQTLLDMKKTEQRRDEIIAELKSLFAELDGMGIEYYYGMPTQNGDTDCYIIIGDVVLDDGAIIIT